MADENTNTQGQGQGQGQGQPGQRARKKSRRSPVYEHFTCFIDAQGNDKAKCNYCGIVLGDSTKNGTSNKITHVRICKKARGVGGRSAADGESHPASSLAPSAPPPPLLLPSGPGESSALQPAAGGPGESSALQPAAGMQEEASRDLARMIALGGYDPSVVDNKYFRSFVRSLDPEYEVPSRDAIEEMCDGIFGEAKQNFLSRRRRAPGRVSLAVGKTKTIKEREVIYIACHFIDDQWKLQKMVVEASVPADTHYMEDGPILGLHVDIDVAEYFIDLISKNKEGDWLSMLAYDITDEDILRQLNNERVYLCCDTITYVDNVLHSVARCLLPNPDVNSDVLLKMMSLHLTRQERLQLLSELELDLDYEWAYNEPWCACYSSLEVLREKGKLVHIELFANLLCKVWAQAYRGIQRISASTFPTSNLCLAELLELREILQSELARFSGDIADDQSEYDYFCDGKRPVDVLRLARDTIDEAIQDSYLVWSVPLALDPRYKLNYIEISFERAFGSEAAKYISQVKTNIYYLYDRCVIKYGTTDADHSDSANSMMATTSADPLEKAWNEHCRDVMAAQVSSCYPETQTELDRYLQDRLDPATQDFDLLKWWKVHSSEYPMVARMAREALAIPTCSKLASDQLAQVRSILRGYSKKPYGDEIISLLSWSSL